jgi:hypothetical protein
MLSHCVCLAVRVGGGGGAVHRVYSYKRQVYSINWLKLFFKLVETFIQIDKYSGKPLNVRRETNAKFIQSGPRNFALN